MNTQTTIDNAQTNTVRASGGHADFDQRPTLGDVAPAGLSPSSAKQVTGSTVFDIIDELSSTGQIVALRSLANGALYAAIMHAHTKVTWDGPTQDDGALSVPEQRRLDYYESLNGRINQQASLYAYASHQLAPLAATQFDEPMDFDTTFDFAANNASQADRGDAEMPDELLEALGITRAQLKLIDAAEEKKRAERDVKLRESLREHRTVIQAEIGSLAYTQGDDQVTGTFTADQHVAMYRKVADKLRGRVNQLVAIRGRFDGALGEAMLVSADAKTVDKAYVQFARKNQSETRDAA